MKVHHIGYFVTDLENAIPKFELLGFEKQSDIVVDDDRRVLICFMQNENEMIELIAANGEGSIVQNMAEKGVSTPYHICYETEDMENTIEQLRGEGFYLMQKPANAIACGNHDVAFLFSPQIGLVELLETG